MIESLRQKIQNIQLQREYNRLCKLERRYCETKTKDQFIIDYFNKQISDENVQVYMNAKTNGTPTTKIVGDFINIVSPINNMVHKSYVYHPNKFVYVFNNHYSNGSRNMIKFGTIKDLSDFKYSVFNIINNKFLNIVYDGTIETNKKKFDISHTFSLLNEYGSDIVNINVVFEHNFFKIDKSFKYRGEYFCSSIGTFDIYLKESGNENKTYQFIFLLKSSTHICASDKHGRYFNTPPQNQHILNLPELFFKCADFDIPNIGGLILGSYSLVLNSRNSDGFLHIKNISILESESYQFNGLKTSTIVSTLVKKNNNESSK